MSESATAPSTRREHDSGDFPEALNSNLLSPAEAVAFASGFCSAISKAPAERTRNAEARSANKMMKAKSRTFSNPRFFTLERLNKAFDFGFDFELARHR